MDHVNLGWVAGIIDGEGSVELGKRTMWRRPEVSVASTDKEMIDLLKILCGGSVSGRSVRKAGWKRSWVWSISSDRALNLLAKIEPLMMCPKKKDRTRLLVYGYKAVTSRNGYYTEQQQQRKQEFERIFFELEGKPAKRWHCLENSWDRKVCGAGPLPSSKLGWIAGMMDGEGSITLQPNKPYFRIPKLSVVSTDKCMLEELKKLIGGNIVNRKAYKQNESRSWMWGLTGQRAISTLRQLDGHIVCPEKARRLKMLTDEYNNVTKMRQYTEDERAAKLEFERRFLNAA